MKTLGPRFENEYLAICVRMTFFHLFASGPNLTVIAKIISGVPDKMSGKHSVLCRTFDSPPGILGSFLFYILCFLCRTFPAH